MADLDKQVHKVLRRVNSQRFVNTLVWCWTAVLALSLVVRLVEKATSPLFEPKWILVTGSLGIGTLVASIVWSFLRLNRVEAALLLDSAFDLRERVSTSMTMGDRVSETSVGKAVLADTKERIANIDVSKKFSLTFPRTSWVPLVPASLIAIVTIFVSPWGVAKEAEAKPTVSADQKQIQNSTKALVRKLTPMNKGGDGSDFSETDRLIQELVGELEDDLADDDRGLNKKQSMTMLSTFRDTLKNRREDLRAAEQMKLALSQLQLNSRGGPGDGFQQALKAGDFESALKAIQDIQEQLKTGTIPASDADRLQKQLEEIERNLREISDLQEKREQLMKAAQNGSVSQEVLTKELKKLEAQEMKMEVMKKLADKLAETQKALSHGDMQEASKALGMSEQELKQLARDLEELRMLEQTLDDLAEMRNAMTCKNCKGQGCSMCQGTATTPMMSEMTANGSGSGERTELEDGMQGFKARTPGAINEKGRMQIGTFVQGPQRRGSSLKTDRSVSDGGETTTSDAISNQRIPRQYKAQARQYFRKFQEQN